MQFVGDTSHNSTPLLDASGQSAHSGHSGDEILDDTAASGRPMGVDTVWNQLDEAQNHLQPNWLLVMAGTNDLVVGHTDTATRYAIMLADIHNAAPSANVIVGSCPPCLAVPSGTVDALNVQIQQDVATDRALGWNFSFADVGNSYTASDMTDAYHPTLAGDQKLGAAWLGAIESFTPVPEPACLSAMVVLIGTLIVRPLRH